MQPDINIIIVNWNGLNDTRELLLSLKELSYKNFSVTVIDNGSEGNEGLKLREMFGEFIEVIETKENLGFAGGNNIGIDLALKNKYEYILLLNNDTIVHRDFLKILFDFIKTRKEIGVVSPKINYFSKPDIVWSAGGGISKIRSSGFAVTNVNENRLPVKENEVAFVSGCCMLIRTEVFTKTGLFDEQFFLYLEDTDLCLRISKAGYKIYMVPSAKIYHKVKSSTRTFSALPLYYETRNRLYFGRKHFSYLFLIPLVYIASTMFLKSIIWILSGQASLIPYVTAAFRDFFNKQMGKRELIL